MGNQPSVHGPSLKTILSGPSTPITPGEPAIPGSALKTILSGPNPSADIAHHMAGPALQNTLGEFRQRLAKAPNPMAAHFAATASDAELGELLKHVHETTQGTTRPFKMPSAPVSHDLMRSAMRDYRGSPEGKSPGFFGKLRQSRGFAGTPIPRILPYGAAALPLMQLWK